MRNTMTKATITARAVHFVKTRDSATTILRKLGVKSRDYNLFIEKMTDGGFAVQAAKSRMHLKALTAPAPAAKPAAKRGGKNDPSSCSAVARTLIRKGKTNAEVWEVLKEQFGLDDKKRGYPSWYRFQLRRAGENV
jgi:hypothetical protein